MHRDYKIVVVTAAGRRRYMQYLVPFVIAADVVDRYDIWVNTHNGADIEFFKRLAAQFPKINLVWQPDGIVNGIKSINAFYKGCVDEDTIYFKLDDDIPWMEPNLIQKMVDFRIDNPDYFLVSPLVINNAGSTYIMQVCNKLKLNEYYNSNCFNFVLTSDGEFCYQLHDWFIEHKLKTGIWESLYCGPHPVSLIRFSINAILWFGKDFKNFKGVVPGDDEEYLSCTLPSIIGKSNCYNGDAVLSHFAFGTQREVLDKKEILERYGEFLNEIWASDSVLGPIHTFVQQVLKDVNDHQDKLMSMPSPYKHEPIQNEPKLSWKIKIANMLMRHLPTVYNKLKERFGQKPAIPKYIMEN